jgi:hypothetical protein
MREALLLVLLAVLVRFRMRCWSLSLLYVHEMQ